MHTLTPRCAHHADFQHDRMHIPAHTHTHKWLSGFTLSSRHAAVTLSALLQLSVDFLRTLELCQELV